MMKIIDKPLNKQLKEINESLKWMKETNPTCNYKYSKTIITLEQYKHFLHIYPAKTSYENEEATEDNLKWDDILLASILGHFNPCTIYKFATQITNTKTAHEQEITKYIDNLIQVCIKKSNKFLKTINAIEQQRLEKNRLESLNYHLNKKTKPTTDRLTKQKNITNTYQYSTNDQTNETPTPPAKTPTLFFLQTQNNYPNWKHNPKISAQCTKSKNSLEKTKKVLQFAKNIILDDGKKPNLSQQEKNLEEIEKQMIPYYVMNDQMFIKLDEWLMNSMCNNPLMCNIL